ncbi:MAG: YeeE/YedE family protein [Nitrospiraceae bacterium]|nr:YeeE/YedE family protein [Nitrospiraceae bacterium]
MQHPFAFLGTVSLLLGLAAGFIMHRSDFCIAGMFRDLFLLRRTVMLRSFLLLVIATMVLFEAARLLGLLSVYPFPLLYAPSAANIVGGFVFGIGMVLAGGCVVGTLYKMGAGSALSMTAFGGMIVGSGLYAEFHPAWAAFLKKTTFFPGKVTIGQILGIDPLFTVLAVAVPSAAILLSWYRRDAFKRTAFASGYLQPARAALLLAAISAVSYLLVGMPLGVTSTFTKIAGWAERVALPEHYRSLTLYAAVPLNFVHRLAGTAPLTGGPGPVYDALAAIQVPLIIGIVAGSALSAALLGELRFSCRVPARQYALAAGGGLLVGLASRMAPTCNVWHLMGGLPLLAASSILFLCGMLGGAWLGGMLLVRFLGSGIASVAGRMCMPDRGAA